MTLNASTLMLTYAPRQDTHVYIRLKSERSGVSPHLVNRLCRPQQRQGHPVLQSNKPSITSTIDPFTSDLNLQIVQCPKSLRL